MAVEEEITGIEAVDKYYMCISECLDEGEDFEVCEEQCAKYLEEVEPEELEGLW